MTVASPSEPLAFPRTNAPLVSVVVAAADGIAATLRAIARNPPRVPIEVIVIGDAGDPGRSEALATIPGLRYRGAGSATGLAPRLDRGAALARGVYVHVLEAGTEPAAGWLDAMIDTFARPACGAVGAKLLRPDGRIDEAGAIVWSDGARAPWGRGDDAERGRHNYVRRADCCALAAFLIRADLLSAIGGFAAAGVPDAEIEADLAFRLRAAGRELWYQPRAVVARPARAAPAAAEPGAFARRWASALARHAAPGSSPFLARDRSVGRTTVLVVDHYLPEPDHDAGSRSMWCMLRQLVDMGMNVKFWPDNHYHNRPYAAPLEAIGIEILYGNEFVGRFENWIGEAGPFLDHAILGRPYIADKYVAGLRRHSPASLLYWGCDIHHLRMTMEAEVLQDPAVADAAAAMRALEEKQWRGHDAVLYHSDSEVALVRATVPGRRAYMLPIYYYDSSASAGADDAEDRDGILFVAGFRHPPNVDAARWLVGEVMPLVRRAVPGVRLTLAGADPTAEVRALAADDVTVTGYLSEADLAARYRAARVAAVPLRFGGGVKGKVIEALHSGVPLVTTPVGTQGLPGLSEIVATTPDAGAFAAHLVRLLAGGTDWTIAADAGRRYVTEHFAPERMRSVLRQALAEAPPARVPVVGPLDDAPLAGLPIATR